MTKPDPDYLAWIDLETTGTDERGMDAEVLEVGVIVTGWDLTEVARNTYLVVPPMALHPDQMRLRVDPVVRAMHDESLLWDDLRRAWRRYHEAAGDRFLTRELFEHPVRLGEWLTAAGAGQVEDVDNALVESLRRWCPDGGRVALAGSGVGHFDSRWITRHLRLTSRVLTHWAVDVGAMRRFLREVVGAPVPDLAAAQGPTSHRALPDAERSLHEARLYRDAMATAGLTAPDYWPPADEGDGTSVDA